MTGKVTVNTFTAMAIHFRLPDVRPPRRNTDLFIRLHILFAYVISLANIISGRLFFPSLPVSMAHERLPLRPRAHYDYTGTVQSLISPYSAAAGITFREFLQNAKTFYNPIISFPSNTIMNPSYCTKL